MMWREVRECGGEVMGRRGFRERVQDEDEERGIARGGSRSQESRVMRTRETLELEAVQ
jgi:hypothetical protein